MLYLASQYAWFLLAAFAMGGLMGWISCAGRLQLSAGPLPYLLAAWLLVLAASGLQAVNGEAALWTETGLLYFAAYLLGCSLACFLRAALPRQLAEAAAVAEAPAAKPGEPAVTPPIGAGEPGAVQAAEPTPVPPQAEEPQPPAKPARKKRATQKKPAVGAP